MSHLTDHLVSHHSFLQFPCQHPFVADPAVCSIDHCNYYNIIAYDELVTIER